MGSQSGSIFARKSELRYLKKLNESSQAEFLVVYGRRRIGKTYLISQYFKDKGLYFELTGTKNATLPEQLRNFTEEYADVFCDGARQEAPSSWQEAFSLLRKAVEQQVGDRKAILFFDELPWLASRKSGFIDALDHVWNRYFSRMKNVIIVVCGSAASWMIENVLNNQGGLHGRATAEIRLLPFTLKETESYLSEKGVLLDRKQITDLYMALGGVAKYLNYVEPGKSAAHNINDICFNGALRTEFQKLYRSLFDRADDHIALVTALASKPSGLTKNELLEVLGLSSGGTSSRIFEELEASGFIARVNQFGLKSNKAIYKLVDEYTIFYLRWIANLPSDSIQLIDMDYWHKQSAKQAWKIWSGLAFETICLKHIAEIKKALGISGVTSEQSTYCGEVQIDLIINRDDGCINLCEMKYYESEYALTASAVSKIQKQRAIFADDLKVKKTIFSTLITTFGLKHGKYDGNYQNVLSIDELFE